MLPSQIARPWPQPASLQDRPTALPFPLQQPRHPFRPPSSPLHTRRRRHRLLAAPLRYLETFSTSRQHEWQSASASAAASRTSLDLVRPYTAPTTPTRHSFDLRPNSPNRSSHPQLSFQPLQSARSSSPPQPQPEPPPHAAEMRRRRRRSQGHQSMLRDLATLNATLSSLQTVPAPHADAFRLQDRLPSSTSPHTSDPSPRDDRSPRRTSRSHTATSYDDHLSSRTHSNDILCTVEHPRPVDHIRYERVTPTANQRYIEYSPATYTYQPKSPAPPRHPHDRSDDRQLRAQPSASTADPNSPPSRSHSHHSALSQEPVVITPRTAEDDSSVHSAVPEDASVDYDVDVFIDPLPPPVVNAANDRAVRKFGRIRSMATLSEHSKRRVASYHTAPDSAQMEDVDRVPRRRQGDRPLSQRDDKLVDSDRHWASLVAKERRAAAAAAAAAAPDEQMEMERMMQFGDHRELLGKRVGGMGEEEQSCYSLISTFDTRKHTDRYLSRDGGRDVIQQGYCRMSWFAGLRTTRFLRLIRNELHCYDSNMRKKLWTVIVDGARVRIQMRQNKLILSKLQCGYLIEFYVIGEDNCKQWAAALLRASSLEKDSQ